MPLPGTPQSLGRTSLEAIVCSSSWDWLCALRRKLGIDVEIVDASRTPLLKSEHPPTAIAIQDLVTADTPIVRAALSAALQAGAAQTISLDSVHLAFVPLSIERSPAGVLVLAQERSDALSPERARGALELMGFWLSSAIEAHLRSAWAEEGDIDRLSALHRLLGDSAAQKSDREIIAAFAEALAIWHDLELCAYLEVPGGDLGLEVSLAGSEPERSPSVITQSAVPDYSSGLSRLSQVDLERLGFGYDRDAAMAKLSDAAGGWVLFVRGGISSSDVARLSRYVVALEQALTRAVGISTSRVMASIARRLLDEDRGAPDLGVRRALGVLRDALHGTAAKLTLRDPQANDLLDVASETGESSGDLAEPYRFSIDRSLPRDYSMTLVVLWPEPHRISRHDEQQLRVSADLFASWARQRLGRASESGERRAGAVNYEDELEQFARRALENGIPVAAVVLSPASARNGAVALQSRMGRMREQVRPSDLVGRLSASEIGILLHNTAPDGARVVVDRMRAALQDESGQLIEVRAGVASRKPGVSALPVSLAQQARENAFLSSSAAE